jgi:uncharacterized membrane protein SpoIIM required for sporulation
VIGTLHIAILRRIIVAVHRARRPIVWLALTYAVSVAIGIAMVHLGNQTSLRFRDRLVSRAHAHDPAAIAYAHGLRLRAATLDFARNLFLGAVPATLGGLAVVLPYPLAAYRGWVGGIVSVTRARSSRLRTPREAAYYLLALVLQLVPYSLAGGAGVHLGMAYYRAKGNTMVKRWWDLPTAALGDVLHIYLLIVPLFVIASLWEFLSTWGG